jgi:hypothetical protein
MNRCRRRLCRWDKTVRNYLAFRHIACQDLQLRRPGQSHQRELCPLEYDVYLRVCLNLGYYPKCGRWHLPR